VKLDYSKPQFLLHPTEDCVVRSTWDEGTQIYRCFVRFSGLAENEVSYKTKIFNDATLREMPITEQEYLDF